jgi:hypothetical protein
MLNCESVMIFALTIFGTSVVIFAAGLIYSAEGYEDDQGFHIYWRNNQPEIADISCVWC